MIRPFTLFDLPALHRYRHRGLFLHSTMAFTWGGTLVPAGAMLSYLAPATGVYTFLSKRKGHKDQTLIAQVIHNAHATSAHFSFLAPESALDSPALPDLLDHLTTQVGERGAQNLLAEVDEGTLTFEALRKVGFAIYARQRIWKVDGTPPTDTNEACWRPAQGPDELHAHILYNALVPAMVKHVEPQPWSRLEGVVYHLDGELQGFVHLNYGPRGILAQPFIHPDTEEVTTLLADFLQSIPNRRSRTIYICVRSYQSWLGTFLDELGAEPGPRQAVMVKRLAVPEKAGRAIKLPSLEGSRPDLSTPIT